MDNFNPELIIDELDKKINNYDLEIQELLKVANYKNGAKDTLVGTKNLLSNTIDFYKKELADRDLSIQLLEDKLDQKFVDEF